MREIAKGLNLGAAKEFDVKELNKVLENAYMSQRRVPNDKAKKSFAPSGIGYGSGRCPRKWFYNFKGGIMREETADPMGVASMSYGIEAHERIGKLFEEAGILIDKEFEVRSEDPEIFGYVDLLINWQGEEAVGEIKTTFQENFLFRQSSMRPQGYHLLQILIYMWLLKKNKGFILYENKNTQQFLTLPVTWTEANTKLAKDTFAWMRTVRANEELPKRPFTKKSKECKSCDFFTHCWSDEDGTVDLPPLEVPK